MLKLLIKIAICCALFGGAALADDAKPDMQPTNLYPMIAAHPDGWLNTSRAITAEDLHGRIILLDFWTYCCINCMHVIPDLQYLEEKYGSSLTVIGIHSAKFANERDSENIRQAILRYGIHHPVVNDADFSVWNGFGVRAWPTFILINPQGIIAATYSGEGNHDAMTRDIDVLLKKYDGKINASPLPIALEADKAPPSVLKFPGKLAYGDGKLFVADSGHQRIAITGMDGKITDSIGSGKTGNNDGSFEQASFNTPQGIIYKDGILYIADTNNHLLRAADIKSRQVSTLAGTGQQGHERNVRSKTALTTPLASPWALAFYPDDKQLVIAMAGTHQLWSYDIDGKTVSIIAGNGNESIDDGRYPLNSLSQPSGLSAANGKLYFVDAETSSLRVFEKGEIATLIGTGLFDFGYKEGKQGEARMQHPLGVFAASDGVYVADSYNHSIRRFDPATGILSNFAGHGARGNKDGALADAEFNEPNDVLQIGDKLYVADTNNNAIRVIDMAAKTVSTLAVTEPPRAAPAPEFSETLPNLVRLGADGKSANYPISVILGLKEGWHINEEAPSYLALFIVVDDEKHPSLWTQFSRNDLKTKKVKLPVLSPGSYHLQGTLYYCEDKAGAQCLLKSFDVKIAVSSMGSEDDADIILPLN